MSWGLEEGQDLWAAAFPQGVLVLLLGDTNPLKGLAPQYLTDSIVTKRCGLPQVIASSRQEARPATPQMSLKYILCWIRANRKSLLPSQPLLVCSGKK